MSLVPPAALSDLAPSHGLAWQALELWSNRGFLAVGMVPANAIALVRASFLGIATAQDFALGTPLQWNANPASRKTSIVRVS